MVIRDSLGQVEAALTLCLVDREREEKRNGEDKGKRKQNISLDAFGYRKERKEENVSILYFFCLVCKGREKKNAYFYLCALTNDREIHILKHL